MGREEKDRVGRKAGRKTGKEMKNQTTAERGKERTGRPAWRLREINPNRHFVALLPRLGRSTPLTCFAKGKQANRTSFEENPTTSLAAEELHLICRLR